MNTSDSRKLVWLKILSSVLMGLGYAVVLWTINGLISHTMGAFENFIFFYPTLHMAYLFFALVGCLVFYIFIRKSASSFFVSSILIVILATVLWLVAQTPTVSGWFS